MSIQLDDLEEEDIIAWRSNHVTQVFFDYIRLTIEDSDKLVHSSLSSHEDLDAHMHNAGKLMLEEVLDIPDRMISDFKLEIKKEEEDEASPTG